jgi:hypothetical protein
MTDRCETRGDRPWSKSELETRHALRDVTKLTTEVILQPGCRLENEFGSGLTSVLTSLEAAARG